MMIPKYKPEGMTIHTPENKAYTASAAGIERAMQTGAIVEDVAVLCDSDMNLHFDLCGIHGILPRAEAMLCRPGEQFKDIAVITRVGKPVCFKVQDIRNVNGECVALLSRKEAQRECAAAYLSDLIAGDVLKVKITHLESFGAFADIGCGISALLPVDSLSVSRISHPRDRLACGSYVYAVVKSIDEESGRFFLSQKELLGTWEENAALFTAGQTVAGIIRSIESYGIFVELLPNLAGLAELRSEDVMSNVGVGDTAAVYIKSIIPERMKVKLILIDTHSACAEPPAARYFIDTEHTQHIDSWQYSPDVCPRTVRTVF